MRRSASFREIPTRRNILDKVAKIVELALLTARRCRVESRDDVIKAPSGLSWFLYKIHPSLMRMLRIG